MLRLLILTSLCAVINASILSENLFKYPIALQRLFGVKREAVSEENKSAREVCETEECKAIAKIIKGSIDESVDPCDDFYEYACGNWAKVNPPPKDMPWWSFVYILMEKINKQIQNITTDKIEPDDAYVVKLGKKWYHSCVDTENIEKRGVEPILSTLWRHGGWPLIMEEGEWDDNMYDWQVIDDHYARLFGRNAFHDVTYDFDKYYPTRDNIVTIRNPHLLLGIERLIPEQELFDMILDDSDENNESGAGSQEVGSREKAQENAQNEDEGTKEENEIDNDSDIQERNKRGVEEHEILRQLLHQVKAKKHEVHHRAIGKHGHAVHNKLKHTLNKKHSNRNKIGGTENEEFHKNKISKHLKRGRGKNHKNKALEKHAKKSKRIEDSNVHQGQQKITNHRVHHAANKMNISKRRQISKGTEDTEDDDENTDQSEQEDDENDNESNEGSGNGSGDNSNEETVETDDEDDNEDETSEDEELEVYDEEEIIQKMKEAYRDYILNVSLILSEGRGIEIPKEQMLKDIDDLIEFAIKLALIAIPESYDRMNVTLAELQQFYTDLGPITRTNKINWVKKVHKLLSENGLDIDDDVPFEINPEYIAKLHTLLKETPARVLVNYVHWNFLDFAVSASTKQLYDLYEEWKGYSTGSREEMCASLIEGTKLIQYQYVQKYVKNETIKAAKDMVDDIQKEVEYLIKESEWMDEETKHFVLDKIIYMKSWNGYPEWYQNTTLVKRYFKGLSLGPSFYENILNYKRFAKFRNLQLIQEKDQPFADLILDPTLLNAFFIPEENSLAFTAADLQSPFFATNRPWYVNFGIIGNVIGHEVNHAFDNEGHLYDKRGKKSEWLTAMANAYNKRQNCFIDQYNNYEIIKGENFTIEDYGNRTVGDNIADSMGLHTVFRAYKRRLRECGKEDPALPGLEQFNNEQSFFLSFANTWCEVMDERMFRWISMDVHSTQRLRLIGPLSNSKEFAKAFQCPLGSPMNPERKCNIWE